MIAPIIHWFRRDLRLADNPALAAAATGGAPVIPLYVLDDATPGRRAVGGAGRWWLHHSLRSLDGDLRRQGSALVLRRGRALDAVSRLAEETGARAVHFTRGYAPGDAEAERRLGDTLGAQGVDCRRFAGSLLVEPEAVRSRSGGPFRVFTPFYKACRGLRIEAPLPPPSRLAAPMAWPASDRLEGWGLLPSKPNWSGGLRECWKVGEEAAQWRLDAFLDAALARYAANRDRPAAAGTSRLSPHLSFGEIGPRDCWHRVTLAAEAGGGGLTAGAETFLRELAWRDFSHHLLHYRPDLAEAPVRPEFASFPWRDDRPALAAWQRGLTGYPVVDAGMRELWRTGWMHNRVRMIAASFLVKDLLLPWQAGEAWFWDTLVDADPASNAANWQWVAGCGADAAPYFRIFNPTLQGEKFDPEGEYVKRWLPELAGLPAGLVHRPWEAPAAVRAEASVRLGETYPYPLVDHAWARRRALEAMARIRH
ncbi:MAG: deoxyribodipyrimidine photo-lyase [Rhodospirillales bacterium]|nr:deoxyribodipyrimidine photo-lyase [Rhodospirillales bacterium]